jgi:hypothetical protein
LALQLWRQLELDEFSAERLLPSRKGTRWDQVLLILVVYRLLSPGSEWRLHRQWYGSSALPDLLGMDGVIDSAPILALAGPGAAIITVEDNYVGGLGSELAEAAASAGDGAPHAQALCVHNIPKSGRTPEDVLAYVHVSVEEIVAAAVKAAR